MRAEPWPIAITGLLTAMIAVCLVFWSLAVRHADVELVPEGKPGITAPGDPDGRR